MKVVVGVDGSPASKAALRFALDEAESLNAHLVVAGVWQQPIYPLDTLFVGTDSTIRERVTDLIAEVRGPSLPEHSIETASGSVVGNLLRVSADADEVILGTRGHGRVVGVLAGSVTHQFAHHTPCPMIVVPAPDEREDDALDNVIVVGVDGSKNSIAALNWAGERASRTGATVRPVLTWLDDYVEWVPAAAPADLPPRSNMLEAEAEKDLAHVIAAATIPAGVPVEPIQRNGSTTDVLREVSRNAALLVVGARGRGGFSGLLLGSISSQCLRNVARPTAIIPASVGTEGGSGGGSVEG